MPHFRHKFTIFKPKFVSFLGNLIVKDARRLENGTLCDQKLGHFSEIGANWKPDLKI